MRRYHVDTIVARVHGLTELHCPIPKCGLAEMVQVIGVHWDGKCLRMELRCENGHAFSLVIENRGGAAYVGWEMMP